MKKKFLFYLKSITCAQKRMNIIRQNSRRNFKLRKIKYPLLREINNLTRKNKYYKAAKKKNRF